MPRPPESNLFLKIAARILWLAASAPLLALPGAAQEVGGQEVVPPLRSLAEAFRDDARARLEAPTPHERPYEALAPGRLARLLEGTRIELRAFERADDSALALGFGYRMAKTLRASEL